MSPTHDYTISNASGSAVRNDLQDALRALNSANSNTSEPTAQLTEFSVWGDTTHHVLKRRNESNNGWISYRKADGTVLIPDASAALPGLCPADDLNTGIYSPAADQISISCGGTARLTITDSKITSAEPIGLPDASEAAPALVFSDDTSTGFYSDAQAEINIATDGTKRASFDSLSFSLTPSIVLENQASVKWSEATGNGTNYISFKAPASIASNVTLTLPATDGSTGQAMVTNGSGTLSWANAGAATGGSTDAIFYENGRTVTADYTITDGQNAGSFGPITINSGVTVTVGTAETWTIV
jgi:hypothetical protein